METTTKAETLKMEILPSPQITHDYPYGRLRCTRETEIEFKKGKGYRVAHTTTNPKTGRRNNPKRSTYSPFMTLIKDPETGYTRTWASSLNGEDSIRRFVQFLRANEEQLEIPEEQSQELWAQIIASFKIGAGWKKEPIQYLEEAQVKSMIKLYGKKANIKEIIDLQIDWDKLKDWQRTY